MNHRIEALFECHDLDDFQKAAHALPFEDKRTLGRMFWPMYWPLRTNDGNGANMEIPLSPNQFSTMAEGKNDFWDHQKLKPEFAEWCQQERLRVDLVWRPFAEFRRDLRAEGHALRPTDPAMIVEVPSAINSARRAKKALLFKIRWL